MSQKDRPGVLSESRFFTKPRDPARIERILTKFRELWLQQPDMRFCQLIHMLVDPRCNTHLFYFEDDVVEGLLDDFLKRFTEEADP